MKNKKQKRYRYYIVITDTGLPIPNQPENGYTKEEAELRIAREVHQNLISDRFFNLSEKDIMHHYTLEPIRCWKW